jgi:putative peptidoglycan lipid II flippase
MRTTDARLDAARRPSANQLIFRALLSIGTAALLVRAMGMVSQVATTSRFGAGAQMDAYLVASGLPLLVALAIAGMIESSVIPVYAQLRTERSKEETAAVFSSLLTLCLVGTAVLTLALLIFRRQFIFLTAPALDAYRMDLAVQIAPVIFPVLLLMVAISFLECILNTEGQFGWPAYAGALVPLATALLVLVSGGRLGVTAIAVGTLVGVGLQLGAMIYRLRLAHIAYRPSLDWRRPEVGRVAAAASPALLGTLVNQAGPLVDQIFASYLAAGSIAALSYALRLAFLPASIVFVTVGRAALPYLSRQAAVHDMQAFKGTLRLYLWIVGLVTAGLAALMLVLAHPLVRILFQRGAFSPADTNHTAVTMMGFVVGLVPMGLGILLARAFSALGKNHVLMYVTIFSVIANAVFDYFMARYWQSVGIALATSAVYFCTLLILLLALRRAIGKIDLLTPPPELRRLARSLLSRNGYLKYYRQIIAWNDKYLVTPTRYSRMIAWKNEALPALRLPLICVGAAALALAIGAVAPFMGPDLALRVAVGLPVILLLLRYPFMLLVAWTLIGALVGSSLPLFQGNNINTALTIPTLILLFTATDPKTFRRVPALALLFLFLLWELAGIHNSPLDTGTFLKAWLTFADFAAVAVLTVSLVSSRRRMLLLIDAMLLVGAFVALYGIAGYLTHQHGSADPVTGSFRIISVFAAAPPLALFLSVVIPLAIYRVSTARGVARSAAAITLVLLLLAVGLTFSRGALLSIPISMVIVAICLPARKLRMGLIGGAVGLVTLAVIAAAISNVPLFARFFGQDVSSANGRTYLWLALMAHFDPWQVLGHGLGAATATLTELNIGAGGIVGNGLLATAPSNLYVGTLYDTGIVGLTILLAALATLGILLTTHIRRTTGERRLLFAMALLILVNTLIQSVEVDDLWTQGIALYFWIAVTLPFAACWSTSGRTPGSNTAPVDRARESVPCLMQPQPLLCASRRASLPVPRLLVALIGRLRGPAAPEPVLGYLPRTPLVKRPILPRLRARLLSINQRVRARFSEVATRAPTAREHS